MQGLPAEALSAACAGGRLAGAGLEVGAVDSPREQRMADVAQMHAHLVRAAVSTPGGAGWQRLALGVCGETLQHLSR